MLRGIVHRFAEAYVRCFAVVLDQLTLLLEFRQVADALRQLGSQVLGIFPLDA